MGDVKSDIQIAREAQMEPIKDILANMSLIGSILASLAIWISDFTSLIKIVYKYKKLVD